MQLINKKNINLIYLLLFLIIVGSNPILGESFNLYFLPLPLFFLIISILGLFFYRELRGKLLDFQFTDTLLFLAFLHILISGFINSNSVYFIFLDATPFILLFLGGFYGGLFSKNYSKNINFSHPIQAS